VADIDKLPSGRWQARWRDGDGRQRKASFRTKAEAVQHLADVRHDRARGLYIDPRSGQTTVGDYAARYVAGRPYRATTAANRRAQVASLRADPLGSTPLNRVRPSDLQAFALRYLEHHQRSTTRLMVGFVRQVLAAAAEDRLILPVTGKVALPTDHTQPLVPMTVGQVRALVDALEAPYSTAALVQAASGLRVGELLGLRVADLDMLRGEVHVREQLHRRDRVRIPLKTPWSARVVPLPHVARDALAVHLTGRASDWVFADAEGRPWQHLVYSRKLAEQGQHSHALRHHYASVLLAAGESVVAVAKRLGHKNATLVMTTYGHLLPDGDDRTRRAIDDAWCAPDVPRAAGTVL
jgi:integrase